MQNRGPRHAGATFQEFIARETGLLSIAATHSQARYALPVAVQEFMARFPGVRLNLHQGSPRQVLQMLLDGDADVGIAIEALARRGSDLRGYV